MSNYAELLRINTVDAENLAEAYAGYAGALEDQDGQDNLPWVASSWLISALLFAVVSPAKSRELFAKAATAYHQLGLPVWRLCDLCSVELNDELSKSNEEQTEASLNDEDAFYAELQRLFAEIDYQGAEIAEIHKRPYNRKQKFNGRVPKIDIPYSLVLQTIYDAEHWVGSEKYDYLKNFSELIRRLYEITENYQADEYHWQNLQGSIVPFEPAALAIPVVFLKKWLVYNSFETLVSDIDLSAQQRVLLNIAHELLTA